MSSRFGIGFAPEMARPAKAIRLVVVVVVRRKALHAVEDRGVGNAVPVLDARRAEVDVVPGVRLFDADVVRDAQSFLVRLVLHRLHDVAVDAEQLDAVDALRLERAHARARRVGVGRPAELRIDEDARRRERALGARVAPGERLASCRCRRRESP